MTLHWITYEVDLSNSYGVGIDQTAFVDVLVN